jgi:hypothetical protein
MVMMLSPPLSAQSQQETAHEFPTTEPAAPQLLWLAIEKVLKESAE